MQEVNKATVEERSKVSGPVLVLGTAPPEPVRETLKRLAAAGLRVELLVRSERAADFPEAGRVHVHGGKGIRFRTPGLPLALLRSRPQSVVVVCGERYWHGNVLRALSLWRRLLGMSFTMFVESSETGVCEVSYPVRVLGVEWALCGVFWALPLALAAAGWALAGPVGALAVLAGLAACEGLLRLEGRRIEFARQQNQLLGLGAEFQSAGLGVLPDAVLGWRPWPRSSYTYTIRIPRLSCAHGFTLNHDEAGRRLTAPDTAAQDARPALSVFGCSFTYGHGLDDADTWPWLVQRAQPERRVLNYGVSAYSTYQCLLRLEQTLAQDRPEVVVLGFQPFQASRNIMTRTWGRHLSFDAPHCRSVRRKLRRHRPTRWWRVAAGGLRLAALFEHAVNTLRFSGREKQERLTTEHVLAQFQARCKKAGARLLIALDQDAEDWFACIDGMGVDWCLSPVRLDEVDEQGRYRYRLYPFDGHPNRAYNEKMAERIAEALRGMEGRARVRPESFTRRDGTGTVPDSHIYTLY